MKSLFTLALLSSIAIPANATEDTNTPEGKAIIVATVFVACDRGTIPDSIIPAAVSIWSKHRNISYDEATKELASLGSVGAKQLNPTQKTHLCMGASVSTLQ